MTELDFLLELFLDEDLTKPMKTKVMNRIREVQELIQTVPQRPQRQNNAQHNMPYQQGNFVSTVGDLPTSESLVASPATAKALADRQAAIASAGKDIPGRTSPRKF